MGAYLATVPALKKTLPMLMKCFYDQEWLDEKAMLSYYNDDEGEDDPGFEEAKKAAGPFLKWLEADEDSDDSSDSD